MSLIAKKRKLSLIYVEKVAHHKHTFLHSWITDNYFSIVMSKASMLLEKFGHGLSFKANMVEKCPTKVK